MAHLAYFRVGIAGCAVVSAIVLNGLTAWWLLRLVRKTAPPLYREYRYWALGGAVAIVLLTAVGGGYLTYLGLKDPSRLPDALSVIVATLALAVPFAVAVAARRWAGVGGIFPVEEPPAKLEHRPRSVRTRT